VSSNRPLSLCAGIVAVLAGTWSASAGGIALDGDVYVRFRHSTSVTQSPDLYLDDVRVEKGLTWLGGSEHWEDPNNWSPAFAANWQTTAVFRSAATHQPALCQGESISGVSFLTAGWAIGGSGHTLTVGSGGIDSAGSGTNTVDPNVTMIDDSTWTIEGDNTLVLEGALSGGGNLLTKDGGGTLVLDGSQDYGAGLSLTMDGGTMRLGGSQTLVLESLALGSEPALDVGEGNLVVDYTGDPSSYDQIAAWVRSGLNLDNDGYWDGPGITSSAAAAGTITAVGIIDNADPEPKIGWSAGWTDLEGVPVDETSVLVKYTYYGDLDFDGIVNSNDYDLIDNTFALYDPLDPINTAPDGGWRWSVGDVTYDGMVDSNDYDKIDNAFALQSGALGGTGGAVAPAVSAAPAMLLPETVLPADRRLTNEDTSHARSHEAISALLVPQFSLSAEAIGLASRDDFRSGLKMERESRTAAAPPPTTAEPVEASVDTALVPDGGVVDLLALSALDVRL